MASTLTVQPATRSAPVTLARWRGGRVVAWLLVGLGVLFPLPSPAQARFSFAEVPGRLSKDVRPLHYRLDLALDPARDDFSGQTEIEIELTRAQAALSLHARDLQPVRMVLQQAGERRELRVTTGFEQGWRLQPVDGLPIAAGRHRLQIDYAGRVNRSGVGLYRAEYREHNATGPMLATQLQAIDARSLFPGFDEPAFRASFSLTVRAPKGLQVLANMPLVEQHDEGATGVHRFAPTPAMPSYLLALAVGRFDVLAAEAAGVPLRIFTAPGKQAQAAYAMAVSQQVLPWLSDYFGHPYMLPKLDQLAVPSVRAGAMEDWGLVSYSEAALLYDPALSSPETQQTVFNTIAHELAHQWFGNLVTAASWEEIWLNEAFATWLADKLTAQFNPRWQMPLQQRQALDQTMARDAGPATRAIRSGRVTEAQVNDVFDNITYSKGGAVLGMLEQWLGEDAFRRGLSAYIADRQYSNATAGDLWHHLAQASGRDVAAVARSWTDRPGLPLVLVDARCVEQGDAAATKVTRVTLHQQRLRDGAWLPRQGPSLPWPIPLRLARGDEQHSVFLTDHRLALDLPGCRAEPLVVNAGGVAYARVRPGLAETLALQRSFAGLADIDQVGFFSDQWALAQWGSVPVAQWLALLRQLPQLDGPARSSLWAQAVQALRTLDRALAGQPAQAALRDATRALLAPELARLGWADRAGEGTSERKLRASLIELLAACDHAPTVAQALAYLESPGAQADALPGSIRAALLTVAGQHGSPATAARLMAMFKTASGEEDRWLLATAMASSRRPEDARRLLAATLDPTVPPNLALALPGLVSVQSPHGALAYGFVLRHWPALSALAGQAVWGRQWLLPEAAAGFNTSQRARQLLRDQARLAGAQGAVPAARAAAGIEVLARLQRREAGRIAQDLRTITSHRVWPVR